MQQEGLSICRLVGGAGGDGSMTDGEKNKAMTKFRERRVLVLVCTNVAQEGVNIQMCSLVINYERYHTETSMLQAGGRLRVEGAMLVELYSDELVFANNQIVKARVKLMNKSVKDIFNTTKEALIKEIATRQEKIIDEENVRKRDEELRKLNQRHSSCYRFLCDRCKEFICDGSEIACHNESNHVVLDQSIWDKIVVKALKKGRVHANMGGIIKKAKVHCKNCIRQDWGVKATIADKMVVVLKKAGVMLSNKASGRSETLGDWKNIEFEDIGTTEVLDRCITDDENYG